MRNKLWCALVIFGLILNGISIIVNPPVKADEGGGDVSFWVPYTESGLVGGLGYNINYSLAWRYIKNHVLRSMEARTTGGWYQTTGLSIQYRNITNDTVKFTLTFNATQGAPNADYRLTLLLNITEMDYTIDTVRKLFVIHHVAFNHPFQLSLNYSDIADIPGLVFSHGTLNGKFWFRIQRNNVPNGVYVLDPEYQISVWGYGADGTSYNSMRKIVRCSDGTLVCTFFALYGDGAYPSYSRSTDGGVTWSLGKNFTSEIAQDRASIAVDSNDVIYAVWDGTIAVGGGAYSLQPNLKFTKSTDKGLTWSSPTNITGTTNRRNKEPSIIVDKNNNISIVFYGRGVSLTKLCIRFIKSTNGGTSWGAIVNVTTDTLYNSYSPTIAADSLGYLHAAWYGMDSVSTTKAQVYYSNSANGGVTWTTKKKITSGNTYIQGAVSIAVDGKNNVHMAWYGQHSGSTALYQIRYTKSINSGSTFSVPSNLTYVNSGSWAQYYPSISTDYQSNLHVIWGGQVGTATYQIRHLLYTNATSTWSSIINLTSGAGDKWAPSTMWEMYPKIGTVNISKPRTGFCFIYSNASTVRYNCSTDLTWDVSYKPIASIPSPANSSTGHALFIPLSILCTDGNLDVMTVTWQNNVTGSYVTYQVNTSVTSGSTVRDVNASFVNGYNKWYWWKVWLNDGTSNVSYYYFFKTLNRPPIISNPVPANESIGIPLVPLMNITVDDPEGQTFDVYWYTNYSEQMILRPDGIGNHNELSNYSDFGYSYSYECVNEVICDGDVSYVWSTISVYKNDTYSLPNVTSSPFHVYNIAVHYMAMNIYCDFFPCYNGYIKASICNGSSTLKFGDEEFPPDDYTYYEYSYMWDNNPWSGVEWTWNDINNLQAGVSMTRGSSCSQVWLVINEPGWNIFNTNNSVTNGTFHVQWSEFNEYNTTYWWKIYAVDSSGNSTWSPVYHFTTANISAGVGFVPSVGGRWSGAMLLALGCMTIPFWFVFWRRRRKKKVAIEK